MKFKSSIGDGAFLGLMVYCLLTLAMYIFWVISAIWWPAIVLTAVLFVAILPVYFGTVYIIGRDGLEMQCGVFVKNISYRDIISLTDADCVTPAFALSHKRICVRYLKGEEIMTTFISPSNRDAFRDAVNTAMQKSLATLKSQGDLNNKEVIEAVELAKERLAKEHELTRAEERAIVSKEEEAKILAKENLAKEIKKLDDIIDGNVDPESMVLSQAQEDLIASRRVAERKLWAKVRKLKKKKDKAEASERLVAQYNLEMQSANDSSKVVLEKPKKIKEPKKTADEKFADKERAKADRVKAKQEKKKEKITKKALADEQARFEETSVFVEEKEPRKKPEIEKVKSSNKAKINTAKPQKSKPEKITADEKKEQKQQEKAKKEQSPKLTKSQKKEAKKFKKEVKVEAKKLKKEALAEVKAEKKSAGEQLAKKADKVNSKKNKK